MAKRKERIGVFEANPEKASAKVSINTFMIGSLFMILTIVWTLNPEKFSILIMAQLVLAIPLLFVSSLAYAKIGYWKEHKLWDTYGWFTNNFGNLLVLNVVGLMTATIFRSIALAYFALIIMLMVTYSMINIKYNPHKMTEKILKFLFLLAIIFLGGVLPISI